MTREQTMPAAPLWMRDPGLAAPPLATVGPWVFYVVVWGIFAVASYLAVRMGVSWMIAVVLMAPLTVLGVAWKPLFGLCLMAALIPIGRGLVLSEQFSSEQAVGILFGVGSLVNIVVTRKRLRFFNTVTLALFALASLALLSILWAEYPDIVPQYVRNPIQMFVYMLLVVTLCREEKDLWWPLRVFVVASLLAMIVPRLAAEPSAHPTRFTIAFGGEQAINPNYLGAAFGLAFFSAVYLYKREPHRMLRWLWGLSAAAMPMAALMTGSRKAAFFIFVPLLYPVLSTRLLARRPHVVLGLLGLLGLLVVISALTVVYLVQTESAERLTDVDYLGESYYKRFSYIADAFEYVSRHPLGAGFGCYITPTTHQQVHNDLFYLMSNLGVPGAALFMAFLASMVVSVVRMRTGLNKWFASAILTYQILLGLGGTWFFGKQYWLFMAVAWLMRDFQVQASGQAAATGLLPAGPAPGLPPGPAPGLLPAGPARVSGGPAPSPARA